MIAHTVVTIGDDGFATSIIRTVGQEDHLGTTVTAKQVTTVLLADRQTALVSAACCDVGGDGKALKHDFRFCVYFLHRF